MIYTNPWLLPPRRRPYVWLREWRAMVVVGTSRSLLMTTFIKKITAQSQHTPTVQRLGLVQAATAPITAQVGHRMVRGHGVCGAKVLATGERNWGLHLSFKTS